MKFSPLLITSLIIQPLRYFYSQYGNELGFKWDEDEKVRNINIDHYYNIHGIALGEKPRIMVNRGTYKISKTGITDNMTSQRSPREGLGVNDRQNMVFIDGTASITIEARNLGTVERLADMTSHFIVWSRPLICDTQGFKEFGLNSMVSDVRQDTEDREKYIVNISVPYFMEERWQVNFDAVTLKDILTSISLEV